MGAGPVIEDDHVAADIEEIAGALSRERRSWRAGAEKRDAHESGSAVMEAGRARRIRLPCADLPPGPQKLNRNTN